MGKPDHKRDSRATARFDPSELAELTKTPLVNSDEPGVREADIPVLAISRAATVHDPLTTGLLAEVSRRSETLEFDEETIAAARASEQVTRHVRRRR